MITPAETLNAMTRDELLEHITRVEVDRENILYRLREVDGSAAAARQRELGRPPAAAHTPAVV